MSYIKKIEPGSPNQPPAKPLNSLKVAGTSKGATWKPLGTPNKGLTPQKSFKESIEERAAQMGQRTKAGACGTEEPQGGLPPKPPSVSRLVKLIVIGSVILCYILKCYCLGRCHIVCTCS